MFKILTHKRFTITQVAISSTLFVKLTAKQARMEEYSSVASQVNKPEKMILYQYKICPFCNRVKALLNYIDEDYKIVEVSPLTKSQLSFTEHKKVPVAVANQEVIPDSEKIIKYIIKNYDIKNRKPLPASFIPSDSDKWMEWSEKKLAVMLYPNITRSYSESFECFEYTNDVKEWSYIERKVTHLLGAFFMSLANGKIKKKYGIVDERAELKQVLNEWTTAIKDKSFLHGDQITLPDLMVYGVLKSIDGMSTFKEIMDTNAELNAWYQRVELGFKSRKSKVQ